MSTTQDSVQKICAVFAFEQPGFEEIPGVVMFHIQGGESDGSTVSAETLRELGIAVPEVSA